MNVEYGTPDETMIEKIEAGLILHGGCAIQGLMQPYYCLDCDTRFDVHCTDIFMDHLKQTFAEAFNVMGPIAARLHNELDEARSS